MDGEDSADDLKEPLDGLTITETLPPQPINGYAEDEVVEELPLGTVWQTAYVPDASWSPARAAPATFAPAVRKKP